MSYIKNTNAQREKHLKLYVVKPSPMVTQYRINDTYKRCMDILAALTGLILFAPVMLLIFIAIKLTSSGPVMYKQERLTQKEKVFHVFKFRTMHTNAEDKTGPIWVQKNDERITHLGKFLRNTHLDELPQLWNVLVGDMSIIGPRPERPVFIEQFKSQEIPRYADRHLANTGITGYAQVLYPYAEYQDIYLKTEADLWYIENWTPLLDLWIIWQTFLHFLVCLYQPVNPLSSKHLKKGPRSIPRLEQIPFFVQPHFSPVVIEAE